jgi:signal peptidase II
MIIFLIVFLVVILDQLIKYLLLSNIQFVQSLNWQYFDISLVKNTGTVFGLFRNNNTFFAYFTVSAIVIIALFLFLNKKGSFLNRFSLALIFAGAVSNLIDRARLGYVVDYIDLKVWPVFNLADSAITIGIALFLFGALFKRKK